MNIIEEQVRRIAEQHQRPNPNSTSGIALRYVFGAWEASVAGAAPSQLAKGATAEEALDALEVAVNDMLLRLRREADRNRRILSGAA